ncbi:MAG: sigma-54-dependent Fis family transcriptional regulator [bacterium]|nr:sigma-54-dependent Fis family transcriptional regulator [bacterium]
MRERWLGEGRAARGVQRWLERAAPLDSTVLITGETGTGKGVLARLLHRCSGRNAGPFVHVDCGALPDGLLEAEFFGHERGAFTGAIGTRVGPFEAAAKGTLFLDEIGELSLRGQTRLLRVLQDRCFQRVGGRSSLRMTARIVAATNLPLEQAVSEGRFRADLFHRLDVLHVELPPLRERPEDLPILVTHFLARCAREVDAPVPEPTPEFLARLAERPWPGNVRELGNLLERLVVWAPGPRLDVQDLMRIEPRACRLPTRARGAADSLEAMLRETGGNVSRAARRLGMARTTLRRRIRAAGLEELIPRD